MQEVSGRQHALEAVESLERSYRELLRDRDHGLERVQSGRVWKKVEEVCVAVEVVAHVVRVRQDGAGIRCGDEDDLVDTYGSRSKRKFALLFGEHARHQTPA